MPNRRRAAEPGFEDLVYGDIRVALTTRVTPDFKRKLVQAWHKDGRYPSFATYWKHLLAEGAAAALGEDADEIYKLTPGYETRHLFRPGQRDPIMNEDLME